MTYDQLYQEVRDYWSDKRRSAEETITDLTTLIDDTQILIDALEEDEP